MFEQLFFLIIDLFSFKPILPWPKLNKNGLVAKKKGKENQTSHRS